MMLVLCGVPPDMPIAVLRNIIQQSCNVDYVLLEEQQRHGPGEPRSVTVGCPGEKVGQQILQCLNGVMLGQHRLYVAPFVSQAQPQSQCYMDGDDPMTGLSNKVPPWKQPQRWSPRRSDVSYRPSPELSYAPPALDARPPYGAVEPPHVQSTLSTVPLLFQARPPSPIRERSPIRVWEQPEYTRRGPSPDRQSLDSIFRGSEQRGSGLRDSYSDSHDRTGQVGIDSHRNDENRGLTEEAFEQVELYERHNHLSYLASHHDRDARKAIPSLLQPLCDLPLPQRSAPRVPSPGTRGRVSSSGLRAMLTSDGRVSRPTSDGRVSRLMSDARVSGLTSDGRVSRPKSDERVARLTSDGRIARPTSDGIIGRRPDLARRPADRTAGVGANARSAPQPNTNSRQKISKNTSHQFATFESDLIENVVKRIVITLFNSRPLSGTGVKPKYRKLMEGLKGEIRKRLSSIRGGEPDAESLYQRYCSTYNPATNRNTKRKGLLILAAREFNQKHVVDYMLMETPWVSPVALESVPEHQCKEFQLKIFLNQTSDKICHAWLKPPNMDAVIFAQEIARFDSADTPNEASSGVLRSEDKVVYDRFKLLTYRNLRERIAVPQDMLELTPGKVAQNYMAQHRKNRDRHLKESIDYCKGLLNTYNGVYEKLYESDKIKRGAQATPLKNGATHMDSRSSLKNTANAGRKVLPAGIDQTAHSTPAMGSEGLSLKQSKFIILLDRASQFISQACLKPPEMDVHKFIRELHHFNSDSITTHSSGEVWTGQLSAADAVVYEHFKSLTLRELLALAESGQEMRNLTSQQIAQVYHEKLRHKMEEHLKCAIKHCEKIHGPYHGLLSEIRKANKPKKNRKVANVAPVKATSRVCNKILDGNQLKSPEINIDDIEIDEDDLEDF